MTFAPVIETLNLWSERLARFAWPVFWQSSILIAVMLVADFFLRRKLRPAVRHALWLVVLIKLLLPPSFALPTGPGWWLRPRETAPAKPAAVSYVVTYGAPVAVPTATVTQVAALPPPIRLTKLSWAFLGTGAVALALLATMVARWRHFCRQLNNSQTSPEWLQEVFRDAVCQTRCRHVRLELTNATISPALYGLFRPVVVLPLSLVEQLTPSQLRAILLHELIHLRNGDVWINCFQSLLQLVFWWHPLLWLANSRIRKIREEVVDDAVRVALGEDSETYAPTLLEVARLALARPLATLGLVGILESRQALRQRVERMLSSPVPKRAGLSLISLFVILAFASVALPMGQAPANAENSIRDSNSSAGAAESIKPNPTMHPGLAIRPATDRGWVEYDLKSGITTATNGAMLTYGDTTISADTITLNRETGDVVAEGSVKLKGPVVLPLGGKFHGNITNLQYAQNQPAVRQTAARQTSATGRKAILNKLQAITLNNVTFDNLPLSEVVNYLQAEAKKRDPEGKGINFIINANVDMPAPAIDPATGLPISPTPPEPVDINGVTIRILPALNDVRMIDVLDAVVKVANARIRYSIEDYGVSIRAGGPPMLFARTIKVDPNTFAQGLESVAGVSVGNFQTGQGGGGQQGSGVTFPRVQAAPNGTGGQAGQGGAQSGSGGGISGVTRPTTAITPQAIHQFFANAGVDLTPPKSIYYNHGSSSLMVHATKEELDTIESAIKAIHSGSAQLVTTNNGEAARSSLMTRTNETKVPVLGDVPILGKAFTRTVAVSSATSPVAQRDKVSQIPNAKLKLFTRSIKLDMNFYAGVQKRSRLDPNASRAEMQRAFIALLPDVGVRLDPAEVVAFDDQKSSLLVHATKENMDAIEAEIFTLSVPPPQINIKARFVEIAKGDTQYFLSLLNQLRIQFPGGDALMNKHSNPDASFAEAMTDSQFRALFAEAKQRNGADVLTTAAVTTLSGRQAQIQMVDMATLPLKINPQALVSPGVTSSNVLITEKLAIGPVLDVMPVVSDDGLTISLNVTATVTGLVGYDALTKGEEVQAFVDGKVQSVRPPLPHIRVRQVQTSETVRDGQTLMVHSPTDATIAYDKDGNATRQQGTEPKDLLVFVTTTIIDAAGNPVHGTAAPNQK